MCGTLKKHHCSIAKSVDYRSKQARLHGLWERLHMKEKFFSGKKTNKQTNRLTVLSFNRMQSQNLQQPGVCGPGCPVCESRVRVCLPADQNVHHSYEFCQGLGSRVQVRQLPSPSPTFITQTPQKLTPLSKSCKEYCYIRS